MTGRIRRTFGEFWIVVLNLFQVLLLQDRKEEMLKQVQHHISSRFDPLDQGHFRSF
jgi:hypothetical protein